SNTAVLAPSSRSEPGFRLTRRRISGGRRRGEAVEPRRRRECIDSGHEDSVLFGVHEDVDEGEANGARACELASVVPVAPDLACHVERAVDGARETNRETLGAARKHVARLRLDDEVDVVVLHRKLDDAILFADGRGMVRASDRLVQLSADSAIAKRRKTGARA